MRIAHIVEVDGLGGGVEQHVLTLSVAQKARGDDPMVVSQEAGSLTGACDEHGIPVAIEARLSGGATLHDRSANGERRGVKDKASTAGGETRDVVDSLCKLFTASDVEVIHCHSSSAAVEAITAGNKIGVPCVYTNHVMRGFRYSSRLDFSVIGVCRSTLGQLRQQGYPEERLYHVPHGTKSIPRAATRPARPSLIWVGRLEQVKGPDIAVMAMADLKRRLGPDCPVLNIYGAGSMDRYLKEMVSVLCLEDKIQFHGLHAGILERCPATDILIVSSHSESGPLVALEALSRGMPIVASRVGEIETMLPDQRYGYIAVTGSIASLADGIETMLSDVHAGRFDPDLPVLRHQELFTIEKMAEGVDAVYKSMATRSPQRGAENE